jgi:hypothetical protein
MPAYTAPFGFEPVQRRDGLPYAGVVREYPIATGYGTALRRGDLVRVNTSGALIKATDTDATPTTTGGIMGVFMGCAYTDAVLGRTYRTYWAASTAAPDAVAMIVDDPRVIFRVAYVSSGVTISAQAYADVIGKNVAVVQNTTATKYSDIAVSGVTSADGAPFRVVDVDRDSKATIASTTYTALLVTYALSVHAWTCIAPT